MYNGSNHAYFLKKRDDLFEQSLMKWELECILCVTVDVLNATPPSRPMLRRPVIWRAGQIHRRGNTFPYNITKMYSQFHYEIIKYTSCFNIKITGITFTRVSFIVVWRVERERKN